MFYLRNKFEINEQSTKSSNKLCLLPGAVIYDDVSDSLYKTYKGYEVFIPYDITFVYFSMIEKNFKVYKINTLADENLLLMFEVHLLDKLINEVIELNSDSEENQLNTSFRESIINRITILEAECVQVFSDIDNIENNIVTIENNIINVKVDGGYF